MDSKKVAELAEAIAKSGAQVTGSVRSTPLQRDRTTLESCSGGSENPDWRELSYTYENEPSAPGTRLRTKNKAQSVE